MDSPIYYQLGEYIFILGALGVSPNFYLIFQMKYLCINKIPPGGTPRSAASHMGLCCLPLSHIEDIRLIIRGIIKHYVDFSYL